MNPEKASERDLTMEERVSDSQKRLAARLKLDAREKRLIQNCKAYARNDPAGMPGHNLAVIIAKMADVLGI